MVRKWATLAGADIDGTMLSNDHFNNSPRLRFIAALTGGIGIRSDGAFILMQSPEEYIRNDFLFMYWWQTRMSGSKKFAFYCKS